MLYLGHTSDLCLGLMTFWQKLDKAKFFTLDLRSVYHHIALDKDAIKEDKPLSHHLAGMSI